MSSKLSVMACLINGRRSSYQRYNLVHAAYRCSIVPPQITSFAILQSSSFWRSWHFSVHPKYSPYPAVSA